MFDFFLPKKNMNEKENAEKLDKRKASIFYQLKTFLKEKFLKRKTIRDGKFVDFINFTQVFFCFEALLEYFMSYKIFC
jgi:hypothetical protein